MIYANKLRNVISIIYYLQMNVPRITNVFVISSFKIFDMKIFYPCNWFARSCSPLFIPYGLKWNEVVRQLPIFNHFDAFQSRTIFQRSVYEIFQKSQSYARKYDIARDKMGIPIHAEIARIFRNAMENIIQRVLARKFRRKIRKSLDFIHPREFYVTSRPLIACNCPPHHNCHR